MGRVNFLVLGLGRVGRTAIFGLSLGLEIFPNPKFSIISPLGQKNLIGSGQKVPWLKTGWPLIYYGSKVRSG